MTITFEHARDADTGEWEWLMVVDGLLCENSPTTFQTREECEESARRREAEYRTGGGSRDTTS